MKLKNTQCNLFFLFILFFSACSSQNDIQNATEDYSKVKIYEEKKQNPQKHNKNKLEGLLIKRADSFYFTNNFEKAKTLYNMALNTVTDVETKQKLIEKLANTKQKIEIQNLEK